MLPSRYFLMAQLAPAVICAVPFLIFNTFFLSNSLAGVVEAVSSVKLAGNLSTSFVFVILLAFVGRSISKDLFERAWLQSGRNRMPTTELLLNRNTEYSPELKQRLFQNVERDFGVHILSTPKRLRMKSVRENASRKRSLRFVSVLKMADCCCSTTSSMDFFVISQVVLSSHS